MDAEMEELKEFSEKTDAKINQIMKNSMGIQIGGIKNKAVLLGQFTRGSKDQVQRHLTELKEQVESHKEQVPKAEDILSDINRVARDLEDEEADAVSIISRINDIVKTLMRAATPIPALIHLGNQLLQAASGVFPR